MDGCGMERCKAGMLARSKAGHDTGKVYVIIEVDDTYVYLADGSIRTLKNPKKKKRKHVQVICREYDIAGADDIAIRKIVKMEEY
jgi:ribosomal protein L14E/L6E/L27E